MSKRSNRLRKRSLKRRIRRRVYNAAPRRGRFTDTQRREWQALVDELDAMKPLPGERFDDLPEPLI